MNAEYRKDHAVCPQCGLPPTESTYEAYLEAPDLNAVRCVCGWSGVTHDLVPRRGVKILVVGTGTFGEMSRDELITKILAEYPDAEIVTRDSSEPGTGVAFDFVVYDDALRVDRTITISIHAYAPPPVRCLGFVKKGRRRGQRRKEAPWSSR